MPPVPITGGPFSHVTPQQSFLGGADFVSQGTLALSKYIFGCLVGGVVSEPLLCVSYAEDHSVSVPSALRVGNTATCGVRVTGRAQRKGV